MVSNGLDSTPRKHKRHVVLFPFMSKGHTIPLLHLSRLLLKRHLSVTIFTTPANRPFIADSLADTSASIVDLPFPENIPDIPAGIESTDKIPSMSLFYSFVTSTKRMQPDFERALQSLLPHVSFVVSDGFLWWTRESASKFGIPRLVSYGMCAYANSVCIAVLQDRLLHGPKSDTELITVTRFPWIQITRNDFIPAFTDPEPDPVVSEFHMNCAISTMSSFGTIFNSFYELEPVFVDFMSQLGGQRESETKTWCVGPLCLADPVPRIQPNPSNRPAWVWWLDQKLEQGSSVLYVAFGSQAEISPEQLKEIAKGLEESKNSNRVVFYNHLPVLPAIPTNMLSNTLDPTRPPEHKRHVVLVPFMSKSHTITLLHLARLFLKRHLSVTIFTTRANRPFIVDTLADTSASIVDLPFPENIPDIPPGIESTDKIPSMSLFYSFVTSTKRMQPDFERALQSLLPHVSFMVSDGFLWWTLESASKFGIPRLVSYGMCAYANSVCIAAHQDRLLHGPKSDTELITVTRFPWIQITRNDFDPPFTDPEPDPVVSEFHMNCAIATMSSFGTIFNSFYELEPVFVDFSNQLDGQRESETKAWCVGPLCLADPVPRFQQSPSNKPAWFQWLDQKREQGRSVLYVAFGSQAEISTEQIGEIAMGLEESKGQLDTSSTDNNEQ
ncbi:hypothetical protein FEM48_Zijuj04G0030900 [Ziziphus jujuba var. spinosa]|uniref:Tudor domain-containing protein n=1 Tax=Ziziphus jujuba var. spinosa TaxID=714518 RepID=A0A978VHH0_ZIZJJ|nr:hypothetical protein FEM48_Zijuj04G0030900 [Ziziphus jujuba var. spinosa]